MEDWKNDRVEASMREGTDKIMKAAHALSKKEETLFPKKVEEANRVLSETCELPEELPQSPKSFEVCLGVGLNQFFPEYVKINLEEDGE